MSATRLQRSQLPFEWYQYTGRGRPIPPEILPPSDLPSPVNGILWEMSELINQELRTDSRRIFKLGGGVDHVTRHV